MEKGKSCSENLFMNCTRNKFEVEQKYLPKNTTFASETFCLHSATALAKRGEKLYLFFLVGGVSLGCHYSQQRAEAHLRGRRDRQTQHTQRYNGQHNTKDNTTQHNTTDSTTQHITWPTQQTRSRERNATHQHTEASQENTTQQTIEHNTTDNTTLDNRQENTTQYNMADATDKKTQHTTTIADATDKRTRYSNTTH